MHRRRETANLLRVKEAGGLYDLLFGNSNTTRSIIRERTMCEEDEEWKKANIILSKEMPSRMRQDFSEHLRQLLPPWISVQFDIEQVEITPICTKKDQCTETVIECRPVIRFDYDKCHSTASILEIEDNFFVTSDLKSVQEIGSRGDVASNHPSNSREIPLCQSIQKVSTLLDSDITDTFLNVDDCKTGSQYHDRDILSREDSNTVDGTSKLKSNETESLKRTQQFHKPITYVNTDFGDLRSVTSVLSEPVIADEKNSKESITSMEKNSHGTDRKRFQGESIVQTIAKNIVRKRSERVSQKNDAVERERTELPSPFFGTPETPRYDLGQKIETPPRTTRTLRTTPPWDLSRMPNAVDDKDDIRKFISTNENIVGDETSRSEPLVNGAKSTTESDASEWDDDNSDSKSKTEPTDSNFSWGHVLASMCEVMIPTPSSNILSSSPIRNFHLSSNKSALSTASLRDNKKHIRMGNEKSEIESTPSRIVDQAKRMRNDFSNQFDEMMRIAYKENDHDVVHANGHKSLSAIVEKLPPILSIDANEDLTLASCLTSSVTGQPHNNEAPEEFEKFPKKSKSLSNNRVPTSNMVYAIPKSKSFESNSLNNKFAVLPDRKNERRFSRLARDKREVLVWKKGKARDFSMRKSASKVEKRFNKRERNMASSVSKIASESSANDYSKESRYSRHENRFYS